MSLLQSLQEVGQELVSESTIIAENASFIAEGALILETADSVLGALSAKLRAGATLNPQEMEEFAILYASLSMLADPNIRAGFNIDLTQPAGQAKFATILNDVGVNPAVTKEVGKIATVTGKARLEQVRNDLRNYPSMKPMDQQLFVNRINKLRIAFERAKNQLAQKQLQPVDAHRVLA